MIPAGPQRPAAFDLQLAAIVGAFHLWGLLVFGATYWIDSAIYVNLAESMRSPEAFRHFYDGTGTWFYGHIQPGTPLLWLGASLLPGPLRWPAFALFQHVLAGGAVFACFRTLNAYWPSRLHLLACALLCALPFHQAMHNAILTESPSASLLLIAFTLSVRLLKDPSFHRGAFLGLLAVLVVVAQFRGYLALVAAAFAALALVRHGQWASLSAVWLGCAVAAAVLAFPLARAAVLGRLFPPQVGMNSLVVGRWFDTVPSPGLQARFETYPYPPGMTAGWLLDNMDYDKARALARYWSASGLDDRAVVRRGEEMGRELRADGPTTLRNRLLGAFASLGLVTVPRLAAKDSLVFREWTGKGATDHQLSHYQYLSWQPMALMPDPFDAFFVSPADLDDFGCQREAKAEVATLLRLHLVEGHPRRRDPFRLSRVRPDVWFLLGLLGAALMARFEPYTAALVLLATAACFWVDFTTPVMNVRYAYPLFPLYFSAMSVGATLLPRWKTRSAR